MLETLSQNRDLKNTLKEVENMLRNIELEKLPSYEIGLEKGVEKGRQEEKLDSALIMINDFNLPPKEVAKKIDLPLEMILKHLDNKK
jgi:hypothetical protein